MRLPTVVIRSVSKTASKAALLLLYLLALMDQTGCRMDGVRQLTIVDESGIQLRAVLVIPLYTTFYGIGVGPEGKGVHSTPRLEIKQAFLLDSGEDLMKKTVPTRGVILPPYIFLGKTSYVEAWLFIKKEFVPRMVQGDAVYQQAPIILTKDGRDAELDLLSALLASKPDQEKLKKGFGIEEIREEIHVALDVTDCALIRAYK